MDIRGAVLDALARRDQAAARALLSEVHRQKAFHLSDYYYGLKDALADAARLHAYHIALMSVIGLGEPGPGVTGIDAELAKALSQSLATCSEISGRQYGEGLGEFFAEVVKELNSLVRELCSRS
ncbi:MAG: hypothetical protein TU35_004360 [Thermoproteus sp. AZ2]|jgi:hypothetical protein|uniref:Uncharacterized protein n=1 Tax=Thermoproteus sp. AZ2 TaxID=1609232 RepID=A0ACC6V0J3_9CREN|nr:MAG: hypothetical protein TU35_03580 [Thermoproteus sp. AZ2]